MSNQEIFEMMSEVECKLFHAWTDMAEGEPNREEIRAAHTSARQALEAFAKAIGCHN